MYQKYQTDAIVLASREQGEADKLFSLFTKEFGLIRARASAVRAEKSRMRYALQNYSFANVSLIRGMRSWRVAGARAIASFDEKNLKGAQAFGRIADLVTKLIAGEEQSEYLYATLVEGGDALAASPEDAIPTIEIVCVARVLYALGYISVEAMGTTLFAHTDYALEHIREAEEKRAGLLSSINRALTETQLLGR